MVRLVRVLKGQWTKSQQGVWRFDQDQTVVAHDILVASNTSIDSLKHQLESVFNTGPHTPMVVTFQLPRWMREPEGETWPPHNIVTTGDVEMMLSVHDWNIEPRLCVIYGAEDVATYQFRCRAPFTIAGTTFLGEGVTEEQHMVMIKGILRGSEIRCSVEVLNELFDEEKMVLLYRFSMEAEKAKNSVDLNVGAEGDIGDHIVPNMGYQNLGTNIRYPGYNVNPPSAYGYPSFTSGRVTRNGIPNPQLTTSYHTPNWSNMDVGQGYWECLMSSRYALELQRIYGVPGSENGGNLSTDLAIGNPTSPVCHLTGNAFPFEVSSTGSSREEKTVGEMGGEVTQPGSMGVLTRDAAVIEKGESSTQLANEANDTKYPAVPNESDVVGRTGGDEGGR